MPLMALSHKRSTRMKAIPCSIAQHDWLLFSSEAQLLACWPSTGWQTFPRTMSKRSWRPLRPMWIFRQRARSFERQPRKRGSFGFPEGGNAPRTIGSGTKDSGSKCLSQMPTGCLATGNIMKGSSNGKPDIGPPQTKALWFKSQLPYQSPTSSNGRSSQMGRVGYGSRGTGPGEEPGSGCLVNTYAPAYSKPFGNKANGKLPQVVNGNGTPHTGPPSSRRLRMQIVGIDFWTSALSKSGVRVLLLACPVVL